MPITCPICKTAAFESAHLDGTVEVERCTTCQGVWITSARYFSYLDSIRDPSAPSVAPSAANTDNASPPPDSPALKLCPTCGKFMRYYPIGHGIPFGIDKCNTCGGVWLNKGEWEILRAKNLHTRLHAFSSDTWQDVARREIKIATERAALLRRLGDDDVQELDRVNAWIEQHPHRDVIISYLQNHLREQSLRAPGNST